MGKRAESGNMKTLVFTAQGLPVLTGIVKQNILTLESLDSNREIMQNKTQFLDQRHEHLV